MITKCQHQHTAPIETIKSLPVTQAGLARHRCAVCAYEQGLLDGFKLATKLLSLSDEKIIEIYAAKQKASALNKLNNNSFVKDIANTIKERMDKK